MVWGMRLPDSFGEFFPDGDFEYDPKAKESGWRERLRLHYLAQAPEEQLRLFDYRGFDHGGNGVGYGAGEYPSYVSGKFTYGMGGKAGPDSLPFSAAEAHEAPLTFDLEKTYATLGSLIKLNSRIPAVDEALKSLIERLEPGVHQFFPIEIRMPKGRVFEKDYFTLITGQYCDSFSPERSKTDAYRTYAEYPGFYNFEKSKKGISGLALIKANFGSVHLWRERAFRETLTCFSDGLMAEIAQTGLRVPTHYKMKEV